MKITSLKRFGASTLALVLIATATATPVAATPGDLFSLSQPVFTLTAPMTPDAGFETARRGRGADDAPGDDRGGKGRGHGADDGPNHTWLKEAGDDMQIARRGRGADDAPGHVRGGGKGRGADDAPNHG